MTWDDGRRRHRWSGPGLLLAVLSGTACGAPQVRPTPAMVGAGLDHWARGGRAVVTNDQGALRLHSVLVGGDGAGTRFVAYVAAGRCRVTFASLPPVSYRHEDRTRWAVPVRSQGEVCGEAPGPSVVGRLEALRRAVVERYLAAEEAPEGLAAALTELLPLPWDYPAGSEDDARALFAHPREHGEPVADSSALVLLDVLLPSAGDALELYLGAGYVLHLGAESLAVRRMGFLYDGFTRVYRGIAEQGWRLTARDLQQYVGQPGAPGRAPEDES